MNTHAPSVALCERATDALAGPLTFHRALADPLVRPLLAQAVQVLRYRLGV
jgi:hypothetical protein